MVSQVSATFSWQAFERRLGRSCHRWSFENIAEGIMEQDNAACEKKNWTETGCTGQAQLSLARITEQPCNRVGGMLLL